VDRAQWSHSKSLTARTYAIQNRPLKLESSEICTIVLQDLVKRGVCRCGGGDALTTKCVKIRLHLRSLILLKKGVFASVGVEMLSQQSALRLDYISDHEFF